jgi:hypothetical protein
MPVAALVPCNLKVDKPVADQAICELRVKEITVTQFRLL